MNSVNHATATGFWCEFCRDYHDTVTCPHPANQGGPDIEDLTGELEAAKDKAYDFEQKCADLEEKIERFDTLAFEWGDKHPKRAKALRKILDE